LNADDLLARVRQDWPVQLELSQLRLLTELQAAEIARLSGPQAGGFSGAARPFGMPEEQEGARHER